MTVACQYPEIGRLADGGFAERLAYVRWVRQARLRRYENDRQLAAALGVGEKWLGKWKDSTKAPEGRSEASAIEAVLGRPTTEWLYDGVGEPPNPELWQAWLDEHAFAGGAEIPTLDRESFEEEEPPTRATGTAGRPGAKKRR
jgi:transcriptional regulator with XRE-family HTH domain